MTVNQGTLDALETAIADEDLEKGLKLHQDGDALQKDGNDPNGGLQKGGDGDEDDDEDEDDDMGDLEKSLAKILRGDDNLAKSIDAAPVLEALVDGLDEVVDGLRGELSKGFGAQGSAIELVAQAQIKLIKGQQALGSLVKSLIERLDELGSTPAAPRKSAPPPQVIEKSVGGHAPAAAGAPQGGELPAWAQDSTIVGQKILKSIQAGKLDGVWSTRYDHMGCNPAALPAAVIETIKDA